MPRNWRTDIADGLEQSGVPLIQIYEGASLRDVRAQLLMLGVELSKHRDRSKKGYLYCVGGKINPSTLKAELDQLKGVLMPDLLSRIEVVPIEDIGKANRMKSMNDVYGRIATMDFQTFKNNAWDAYIASAKKRFLGSAGAQDAVFEYLILSWLRDTGPQSTVGIMDAVGVSYKTVSTVIKDLEAQDLLIRSSNRSVELTRIPGTQWNEWLRKSRRNQATVVYASTTKLRRPIRYYLERLFKQANEFVSVGGVEGSTFYFKELDITSGPRLDLVVYGDENDFGPDAVMRVDPSQDLVTNPNVVGDIAVHYVGRRPKRMDEIKGEVRYADELQCMANLHALGLDGQVDEMMRYLINRRNDMVKEAFK